MSGYGNVTFTKLRGTHLYPIHHRASIGAVSEAVPLQADSDVLKAGQRRDVERVGLESRVSLPNVDFMRARA